MVPAPGTCWGPEGASEESRRSWWGGALHGVLGLVPLTRAVLLTRAPGAAGQPKRRLAQLDALPWPPMSPFWAVVEEGYL